MNAKDAILNSIQMAQFVCQGYLGDLNDEELFHRPDPGCNHINWQVGHLIVSENHMIDTAVPGSMPPLPEGFAEKYTKATAQSDDQSAFATKAELMDAFETQRAGTLAALEKVSDADLAKSTPESMQSYAPTVLAAFNMQGGHWMMHCGQWAVVRRQLGRPPLF